MLQQSDVDALLAALRAAQESGADHAGRLYDEVRIYDFAQPDNLPSEFLHILENINTTFAHSYAGVLTGYLMMSTEVTPLSIDLMTYRQFCNSVPEVTALGTFSLTPLEGAGIFEMNPHIAWYILDRGLGGQGEIPEVMHDFTPLERGLLDDLFRRLLRDLGKSWERLLPLRPVLREVLSSAAVALPTQGDDRMVVCSFSVKLAGMSGVSTYCIPVSSLDFDRLLRGSADQWVSKEHIFASDNEDSLVVRHLMGTEVHVRACLTDIQMTLGELATLRVGDVINLDNYENDQVEIRVANDRIFIGNPVKVRDHVAVEITEYWTEDDDDGFSRDSELWR